MKSKNALLSALLIGVVGVSISPAASAFGLGDLKSAIPGAGGSSVQSVSAGDIDAFIKTAQDANQMIDASSQYIFKALGNQKDIAELEAKRAAANDVADPKERKLPFNRFRLTKQRWCRRRSPARMRRTRSAR